MALTFGLALPNFRHGASGEGILEAAQHARRLGWGSIWTTDHILPDTGRASQDYSTIFEALTTLAWLSPQVPDLQLGTSVIVVPMRNAAVLAKQIATLDALSGGRLIVGVGVGWNEKEFANIGQADRFRVRGRYLDETIALWRHLWSGTSEPFHARFHDFDDFSAMPVPIQGDRLPIWVGGRSEAALQRAGRAGDGYHASTTDPAQMAERVPVIRAAATEAGRPEPRISVRVRVTPEGASLRGYALSGGAEEMLAELDAFERAGVGHVVVDLVETDAQRHAQALERFHRDVASVRSG